MDNFVIQITWSQDFKKIKLFSYNLKLIELKLVWIINLTPVKVMTNQRKVVQTVNKLNNRWTLCWADKNTPLCGLRVKINRQKLLGTIRFVCWLCKYVALSSLILAAILDLSFNVISSPLINIRNITYNQKHTDRLIACPSVRF